MSPHIKNSKSSEPRVYLRWSHPTWAQDLILEIEDEPSQYLKKDEDKNALSFRFVKMTIEEYKKLGLA